MNLGRPDDDPIITVGDYKAKRKAYDEAVEAASEALAEIKSLDPFLKAVEQLSPELGQGRDRRLLERLSEDAGSKGSSTSRKPKSKTTRDHMREILDEYPNGMGGADLHRKLAARGVKTQINYVYSSLTKMRDNDELIQSADKSYRLKKYRNIGLLDIKQSPDRGGQG